MSKEFTFDQVEKEVMKFIARKSNTLHNINTIFNNIIEDEDVVNPEVRKDLKFKLGIVMSQLDSKQHDVTVIKKGSGYLVGYKMEPEKVTSKIVPVDTSNKEETELENENHQMAKMMFEFICNSTETNYEMKPRIHDLIVFGLQNNSTSNILKLKEKYEFSFFDKNDDGKSIIDLFHDNIFVLKESLVELSNKQKNNEQTIIDLTSKNVDLTSRLEKLETRLTNSEIKVENNKDDMNDFMRKSYHIIMFFGFSLLYFSGTIFYYRVTGKL